MPGAARWRRWRWRWWWRWRWQRCRRPAGVGPTEFPTPEETPMLSNSTARWLQRRGIHYGWLVAAITFLTMLTMSAALGLPGAMLQPLSREFGWSTEQISSSLALRFALFGLLGPFAAGVMERLRPRGLVCMGLGPVGGAPALVTQAMLQPLSREFGWSTEQISSSLALRFALFGLLGPFAAVMMERFGLRAVMCMGLALVGGAMAMVTQATQLWHLFLLWSLLLGMGTGLTALVLGAVVANRWFAARRGLVIGVLTASAATGQLAFLPLAAWMIEHWGWRSATVPVFVASALIAVLALLFVRDRPSDLGLAPFGGDASAPPPPAMAMNFGTPFKVLAEAARNRTFWLLAGTFFICGLSTNGLVQTHFISLCGDNGMGAVPAASVLAMMGAFDFVGTVLSGWLSDRYDNRKLLFWYRSEEHTSELQSPCNLVCRLLLEKKKTPSIQHEHTMI